MATPPAIPNVSQSGFARSENLNIAFQVYGSGPPVVLVHGWGSDTENNWLATGWIADLAQRHKVISLDVRGHGKSDKPHTLDPFSYAAMSNDVIAVMDSLDISKCHLLGYSMGAFMGA